MSFFYSLIGFVIAIGILVAVHEFGHFWVARKLGVKVLRYSVGFGKPIWKKVAGDDQVEYVIAAIPLGGYVKMLGQGDPDSPIEPHEAHRAFDNQPIWKRSLIVAAGPGINFLFAILLFFYLGLEDRVEIAPIFGEVTEGSLLADAEVSAGDKLLSVDGKPVEYFHEHQIHFFNQVLKREDVSLKIESQSGHSRIINIKTADIPIYDLDIEKLIDIVGLHQVERPSSNVVDSISKGYPAAAAGILPGDKILSINGVKIKSWNDLVRVVMPAGGEVLLIQLDRNGVLSTVSVTPKLEQKGDQKVGILGVGQAGRPHLPEHLVKIPSSFGSAITHGVSETWSMSVMTVRMLWKMLTLQVSHKNISGPITIAQVAGDALQLLMYAVESVAGKKASEKVFAVGQRLGIVFLACLMGLAFYNDIFRLLH